MIPNVFILPSIWLSKSNIYTWYTYTHTFLTQNWQIEGKINIFCIIQTLNEFVIQRVYWKNSIKAIFKNSRKKKVGNWEAMIYKDIHKIFGKLKYSIELITTVS